MSFFLDAGRGRTNTRDMNSQAHHVAAMLTTEHGIPAEVISETETAIWDDATGAYWAYSHRDAGRLLARVDDGERYSDIANDYEAEEIGPSTDC